MRLKVIFDTLTDSSLKLTFDQRFHIYSQTYIRTLKFRRSNEDEYYDMEIRSKKYTNENTRKKHLWQYPYDTDVRSKKEVIK